MGDRYIIKDGSESRHCCFNATVLDTRHKHENGDYNTVCECFNKDDAEIITKALNLYHNRGV